MTRERWKQMTPDQRRSKIAELCGWKPNGAGYWRKPRTISGGGLTWVIHDVASLHPACHDDCGGIGSGETTMLLPDCENDLNAMNEAEKIIRVKKPKRNGVVYAYVYEAHLLDLTNVDPIYATAAQRAEAFVLTLEPEEAP